MSRQKAALEWDCLMQPNIPLAAWLHLQPMQPPHVVAYKQLQGLACKALRCCQRWQAQQLQGSPCKASGSSCGWV